MEANNWGLSHEQEQALNRWKNSSQSSDSYDYTDYSPREYTSPRPTAITVVCTLLVVALCINVLALPTYFKYSEDLPGWFTPYALLSLVGGIAATIGLWNMKQWAATLYIALAITTQIALLIVGAWSLLTLIIPFIVVCIIINYFGDMD